MSGHTDNGQKKKVLVTGAEGVIGTAFRQHYGNRYDIHSLTLTPQDFPSHVANIADFDAMRPAFNGMDAVVHLAASIDVRTPWEDILPNNIIGTRNVYEAAHQAGVERVVFASSNHAIGMYEVDGAPEIHELDDPRVYDHTAELRPDSLYGVSKAYGEILGRYYLDRFGLKVYCLRIGSVRADDDPVSESIKAASPPLLDLTVEQRLQRFRATWLSKRDCSQLISRCLDTTATDWAVVYGISNNPRQFWDISHAREVLGYDPQDSAPL